MARDSRHLYYCAVVVVVVVAVVMLDAVVDVVVATGESGMASWHGSICAKSLVYY